MSGTGTVVLDTGACPRFPQSSARDRAKRHDTAENRPGRLQQIARRDRSYSRARGKKLSL
jgi:hypothetical protein